MLPKHWGEPVGRGEVGEQLAAKQPQQQLPAPRPEPGWHPASAACPCPQVVLGIHRLPPSHSSSRRTLTALESCPSSAAALRCLLPILLSVSNMQSWPMRACD